MQCQCSFKILCSFAPIMLKVMLAQSAKAYLGGRGRESVYVSTSSQVSCLGLVAVDLLTFYISIFLLLTCTNCSYSLAF